VVGKAFKWLISSALFSLSMQVFAYPSVNEYFNQIKQDHKALNQFLYNMPKGGELHYHFSGGVYPEVMLEFAKKKRYCVDKITFALLPPSQSCQGMNSRDLQKKSHWYQKILHAWSMDHFQKGQESGHDHFFSTFRKFNTVFHDNRSHLLAPVIRRAAAQHEHYIELMFSPKNLPAGRLIEAPLNLVHLETRYQTLIHDPAFQLSVSKTIGEIDKIKRVAKHDLDCDKRANQRSCQLETKFIYHAFREQPLQGLFAQVLQGFLAAEQSDEIVGVNLVQAEDGPISLRDYKKHMAIFGFLHQKYPRVHITLHAGELSDQLGKPQDRQSHIHDAIFKGKAERIGHGVDILSERNHEALLRYMAKKYLPVEINLSSNAKILNVAGSLHPLKQYLNYHVPVVLSTDDEGILRTSLTHEYQLAAVEYDLDYETLKLLSRNALTYSFLPGGSLWDTHNPHEFVGPCRNLNSAACLNHVAHSPKAKLQRALELDYIAFEKRILTSPRVDRKG
jgi:adenosine deaminase